jgi:GT2 family glycosyltransferase
MAELPFHYIITIHNKEALLPAVLAGIARCASTGSIVVPVLDGCTDRSAEIVSDFAASSGLDVRATPAPDVHEIKSINLGLRRCGPGFCVVLQDDVVLNEPDLEPRLRAVREEHRRALGCVSLRMGGDLATESFGRRFKSLCRMRRLPPRTLDETVSVSSPFDTHPVPKARVLKHGEFAKTAAVYKSPICFMPELRDLEPELDEALAPYACDDIDLSVRALRRGLHNGVLALAYASDVDWGGTRKSTDFARNAGRIIMRNRAYLWQKHHAFLLREGRPWLRYC